jgi:hypothetical protein
MGATTLSGAGSADSGIEVLDVPSRARKQMKRPPTASGAQQNQRESPAPPGTGNSGASGVDPHRPYTGPMKDSLGDSADHNPTHVNAGNFNFAPRTFNGTSDDLDFERGSAIARSDDEESYYYEEEPQQPEKESDESEGYYMPTLIHKAKPPQPKAKKVKKKKTKKPKNPDSARGGIHSQPLLPGQDFSKQKSATLSGQDSREMVPVQQKLELPVNNSAGQEQLTSMQGNLLNNFQSTFSNQQAL